MNPLHEDRAGDSLDIWFDEANGTFAIGTRQGNDEAPVPVWIDADELDELARRASDAADLIRQGVMP